MNYDNVFNNVQEKIALDNFKVESIKIRKTKRRLIFAATAALVLSAGYIIIKNMAESNEEASD